LLQATELMKITLL